jgi:two-component system, OmpR family, sensor histidine kinase ChvG
LSGRCCLINGLKEWAKRHWPELRLRTILFATLFVVAGLPGISAVFLRVYENALVRQTEAELMAQGAVVVALIEENWPGGAQRAAVKPPPPPQRSDYFGRGSVSLSPSSTSWATDYYQPERPTIDLRTSPILPERPEPVNSISPAEPAAMAAAAKAAPILRQAARSTLAAIRVLDGRGIIVYGGGEEGRSLGGLPEVQRALNGLRRTVLRTNTTYEKRTILEAFSRGSTLRVHHARPIKVGDRVVGAVLLSRSPRGLFIGMYEDRGKIALGAIGIFGLLLFLVGLLTRGIARPIDQLAQATKGGMRGKLDVPETPATAASEIRTLYANYRDMAERIEKRSRYLQDFAAAVSHEFKMPIAGIKGALELLEDHGATMDKSERTRFLSNARADADRMQHLVERLLDLARADMSDPSENVATDLVPVIGRVVDAHRSSKLGIVTALDGVPKVGVPAATIEAVLETLIENSRQAGASAISIVSNKPERGLVVLTVSDNGHGVPPGDRDRLFESFFTSRRREGGTGLGLAIARSLLAASGATIDLVESDGGASFRLFLPLG